LVMAGSIKHFCPDIIISSSGLNPSDFFPDRFRLAYVPPDTY